MTTVRHTDTSSRDVQPHTPRRAARTARAVRKGRTLHTFQTLRAIVAATVIGAMVLPGVAVAAAGAVEPAVVVNPVPVGQRLDVVPNGTGAGTVTSNPAGISCGFDCTETYPPGTQVTLTATPRTASVFAGWTGACSGLEPTCTVTMSEARNVTATFNWLTRDLTVTKAGNGNGTVTSLPSGINCGNDCTEAAIDGSILVLTAIPAAGSTFTGWSGACTGTNLCAVNMNQARTVTATFTLYTYALTVTRAGTGTGTITSNPQGITCGADCRETLPHGTVVTLTATPGATSWFAGWNGACTGTQPTCTVTITQARTVGATFTAARTAPSAPGSVTTQPGNASLSVRWTAPTQPGDTPITRYEYSLDNGPWVAFPAPAHTARTGTITGLVNGRAYQLRLRAVNTAGVGTASTTTITATPATTPGTPTGLTITTGDRTLTLRFNAPTNGGSAITRYEYSLDDGTTWGRGTTAATITVPNLTNGRTYQVRVRAVNTAGAGAASTAVTATPRTTAGTPTGVTVTAGDRSLTVTWAAPASNGGTAITRYEVSTDGGTRWTSTAAADARRLTITGLVNGTTYQVRIRAVNAAGPGTGSTAVTGRPAGAATAPSAPARPTVTAGKAALTVKLTAPATGGSAITAYEYTLDGGTSWTRRTTTPTATTFTITNLVGGRAYQVAVRAVNAIDIGAASPVVTATPTR